MNSERINRQREAFEHETSQEGEDMHTEKALATALPPMPPPFPPPPQQLLLSTGSIATRSAASLSAGDTLHLSVHSLAPARAACKGSVIDVCEACACPCMVHGHVCVWPYRS